MQCLLIHSHVPPVPNIIIIFFFVAAGTHVCRILRELKMFEPKETDSVLGEFCSAPIAVAADRDLENSDRDPTIIVGPGRSLFLPNDSSAIVMISLKRQSDSNISPQRSHGAIMKFAQAVRDFASHSM